MTPRQIRAHVEKRGRHTVHITPSLIFYWWRVFNKAAFNHTLPRYPDKLIVKDFGIKTLGWARTTDVTQRQTLGLNHHVLPTRQWFLAILIHEMVHLWVDINYPNETEDHGKRFMSWRGVVESFGLPLEDTYGPDDFHKLTHCESDTEIV